MERLSEEKLAKEPKNKTAFDLHRGVARILATEDITVSFGNYSSASFDTKGRVLRLPLWDVSKAVFDMLVAHEVGHALWTDDRMWNKWINEEGKTACLNIVEDVRIERLIQKKYPGLFLIWKEAYNEIYEDDLFGIGNRPLSSFPLHDRINLYAKFGERVGTLGPKAMEFYKRCYAAETMQEAYDLALELKELLKEDQIEQKRQKKARAQEKSDVPADEEIQDNENENETPEPSTSEENRDSEEKQVNDINSPEDDKEDALKESEDKDVKKVEGDSKDSESDKEPEDKLDEPESETASDNDYQDDEDDGFYEEPESETSESLDDFADSRAGGEIEEFVHQTFDTSYSEGLIITPREVMQIREHHRGVSLDSSFQPQAFKWWYKSVKSRAGELAREFERRRRAREYRETSYQRTGKLDITKIHRYRFEDDIFAKAALVADGKNHAVVLLIDNSGSMNGLNMAVEYRSAVLMEFCRIVDIPYEVYSFTDGSFGWMPPKCKNRRGSVIAKMDHCPWTEKKSPRGTCHVNEFSHLKLVRIFDSTLKHDEHVKMTKQYFTLNRHRDCRSWIDSMNMTPLYSSLYVLTWRLFSYWEKVKADRMSFIVLTDGRGQPMNAMGAKECVYDLPDRKRFHYVNEPCKDYRGEVRPGVYESCVDKFEKDLVSYLKKKGIDIIRLHFLCHGGEESITEVKKPEFKYKMELSIRTHNDKYKSGRYQKTKSGHDETVEKMLENRNKEKKNESLFVNKFIEGIA